MKKVFCAFLALALPVGAGTAAWAVGVANTPHDVRVMTGTAEPIEPCAMCHTPHKGTGAYPIWNRSQGAQVYTMYDSTSFDMDSAAAGPNGPSALCLICHNGVASTLVNYPGPGPDADFTNDSMYDWDMDGYFADLGTSMTDDHPISFQYDPTKDLDKNGFPAATVDARGRQRIEGASGTDYFLYTGSTGDDWLECSTCHSVHNSATYAGQGEIDGQVYFLRGTNENSALCQDCHVQK